MAEPSAQRVYRAPCPGCGAPVTFVSAASTHAVCGFCRSTVVREGERLSRLGKMAEVFGDFSPLQLGTSGRWWGQGFRLIGRLVYRYEGGTWTEWLVGFDDGSTAYLSEDNGAFVFSKVWPEAGAAPDLSALAVGGVVVLGGRRFSVASVLTVALATAEGELPHLPPVGQPFVVAELRNEQGEVCSLDGGITPPQVTLGQSVLLEELSLSGLRDESAREEKGRHFECPNCGAPVDVALAQSLSVACGNCHSVIDLSAGLGKDLKHATQDEPVAPLIPLGRTGQLQGVHWQVVGFQHRMGKAPGDEESFGWNEYLLFNRKRGFSFLVDAEDGWSMVKPTTGAPVMTANGQSATYLGTRYTQQYAYNAETTYVAGEFYWKVERGQTSFNRDFASGASLLSMEKTADEVSWSSGSRVSSDTVAKAFGLQDRVGQFERADAAPTSQGAGHNVGTIVFIVVVLIVVSLLESRCSDCDPNVENCSSGSSYRSSGGSYGGYSGGGGHK